MPVTLLDSGPMGKVVKTYLILIGMATQGRTIFYEDIGKATGVAARAVGGLCLDPISLYCEENDLPSLTSIVVRMDTGEPGDRYVPRETPALDREEVYAFPWLDYAPPTIKDFRHAEGG